MSTHEKKPRPTRLTSKPPGPSSLTTPPRAALLHGRSKTNDHPDENASIKGTPDTDTEDALDSASAISILAREREREREREIEEKDTKIAELEKELSVMEDEFDRELAGLSHKLTNENETSVFWQQKHSSLHQSFLKVDTELKLLRQELAQHSGRETLDHDVKTRISSLIMDRDAFREAYNEAMGELRGKEGEVQMLRGQVRGLKSFVSKSGVVGEQVADEIFGEGMRRLGNGVQNWVISNFRRVKIEIERVDEEKREQLGQIVSHYEALASSSKVHLIQSLVSHLLAEHVFGAYFVGLSKEHSDDLLKVEKYLSTFGSAESMNSWRSTTLTILQKEAPDKLQAETEAVIKTVITRVNNIMDSIGDLQHTDARDQSLRTLITSAVELSRLLRVQKAVFSIMMPSIKDHQRTMFDPETMEDISGEDEDTLNEREIRCVTFPGIVKNGDENGERNHLRNVVAKVRVLCAPD